MVRRDGWFIIGGDEGTWKEGCRERISEKYLVERD